MKDIVCRTCTAQQAVRRRAVAGASDDYRATVRVLQQMAVHLERRNHL